MKTLVFDAGPIINLALNNLLWVIPELKKKFAGNFVIPPAVVHEVVETPLQTRRFKLEALQVSQTIDKGYFTKHDAPEVQKLGEELSTLANSIFSAHGHYLTLVHPGEIMGIALVLHLKAEALVIDERTTRLLIEDCPRLKRIMEHRLHTPIRINQENLQKFQKLTQGISFIRSIELITLAYEYGFLDQYITKETSKRDLLDGALWAIKLNGCAVSEEEILEVLALEEKTF